MDTPQIRVLPQRLSEFTIRVFGTERHHQELRDNLLHVLTLADATSSHPSRTEDLAEAVAEMLITLDTLYQESFWRDVEKYIARDCNRLTAAMICQGYHDPEGDYD